MTSTSKPGLGFTRTSFLVLLTFLALLRPALAADTNAAPEAEVKTADTATISTQDLLRAYLQFQEQLHATQLAIIAIEKNRQEAEAAAASNSLALNERLRVMEKTIANQHLEQLNGLAHLDKTILIVAGAFAFMGFLVLLLSAFLQWAALNRLAAAATGLSAAHSPQVLGTGEALLPQAHALEQSNIRFLGLMEQMERRLHGMETSVKSPANLPEGGSTNGSADESSPAAAEKNSAINLLLNKSQTFLKLDKTEAALQCLDEILALDPGNADALVKKGAALERLQRINAAIECYDRAIAQDSSMVIAYLCKAGLFNRMERYSEALACYEQALNPGKTAKPETLSSNKARSGVSAA